MKNNLLELVDGFLLSGGLVSRDRLLSYQSVYATAGTWYCDCHGNCDCANCDDCQAPGDGDD